MDTECEEKHSWDFQLDKNLVIALGWSLHLCITQHPLFTSVIQGWGPRASPLFKRCTKHLGFSNWKRPDFCPWLVVASAYYAILCLGLEFRVGALGRLPLIIR